MYFNYQNLKKAYPLDKHDKSWIHGRAWLRNDSDDRGSRNGLHAEWVIGSKTFNLGFSISKSYLQEYTMQFVFAIPPIAIYWDFTWAWLEKTKLWDKIIMYNKFSEMHGDTKEFSFRIFEWTIWGEFCKNWGNSRSRDPWWMSWNINIPDLLFGRSKYSEEIVREQDVKIPMPEKEYDGKGKLLLCTWKRPRWFAQKMYRTEIDVPEGIPHPGKGTCDYNCGDDKLFSETKPNTSIKDAICDMVRQATWYRLNYPQ